MKKKLIGLMVILLCLPNSINSLSSTNLLTAKDILQPINQRISNKTSDFKYSPFIDSQFQQFIDYFSLKGISVAIVKDEKLVFARSYGHADIRKNQTTTPGNVFRIASVSKLVSAIAIMKLVEEGKIHLYDKVFGENGFFNDPKFLDIKDPRLKDITVLNLLNHSSGWTQRYGDPMFNPLPITEKVGDKLPATPETFIKFAISRGLDFTPGTDNNYSNMGYMFLGEIVEKVTGINYENYVNHYILYPNGIFDMHLGKNLYEEKFPNEVEYHEQFGAEKIKPYTGDSALVSKVYGGNDITLLGAAGAWVASAPELAKLMVLIDGFDNAPDFLSKESIYLMTGGLGETLGWKEVEDEGWIRTGSFAGTSAMLFRGNNGIEWVFLSNTSSWNGPFFSKDIKRFMNFIISKVDEWPERDLFNYYQPLSTREKRVN